MELKELASAFAAKMGIDGLAVEDGACALEIDGIPLQIAETAVGGALLATAVALDGTVTTTPMAIEEKA